MQIVDITKEQLISFITDKKRIVNNNGSNGILSIYDENTLIKIHKKEIINSYILNDFDYLDEEIENRILLEKDLQSYGLDKLSVLKEKINKLAQTNSSLVEGIIRYRGYPIGVLVKSYLDYENLADVLLHLDEEQKLFVRDRIEILYQDLMDHDVYPRDIKIDNILVKMDNLDVKITDLDDNETVIGDKCHSKENSLLSLEKMLALFDSYLEQGKCK